MLLSDKKIHNGYITCETRDVTISVFKLSDHQQQCSFYRPYLVVQWVA